MLLMLEQKFNYGVAPDGRFNPRLLPTLRELQNLQKTVQHELRPNRIDSRSLEYLIDDLEKSSPGVVLKYRPQVMDDGKITQRFMLVLSTPFLTRMLKTFGSRLVFMDATYGMIKYGYPLISIVVRDEYTNAVPVAFCIADHEDAATYEEFLRTVAEVILNSFLFSPNFKLFYLEFKFPFYLYLIKVKFKRIIVSLIFCRLPASSSAAS